MVYMGKSAALVAKRPGKTVAKGRKREECALCRHADGNRRTVCPYRLIYVACTA